MSTITIDQTLAALEEQVGFYRRLVELAEHQHVHVQQGGTEELLGVLQKRQEVLNHIARLEHMVGPQKRRWSAYLAEVDAAEGERAQAALVETRRLLEQITAADRIDALVLQQRKLNLGRPTNRTSAAKQVNRAYAATAYGPRQSRMDLSR